MCPLCPCHEEHTRLHRISVDIVGEGAYGVVWQVCSLCCKDTRAHSTDSTRSRSALPFMPRLVPKWQSRSVSPFERRQFALTDRCPENNALRSYKFVDTLAFQNLTVLTSPGESVLPSDVARNQAAQMVQPREHHLHP